MSAPIGPATAPVSDGGGFHFPIMLDNEHRCSLRLETTAFICPEPEVSEKLYPIGDVARAARMPRVNITRWIERGYPVLRDSDVQSSGRGHGSKASFETTIQLAVASALSRWGVPPRDALSAALSFSSKGQWPTVGPTYGVFRPAQPHDPFPALEIIRFVDGDALTLPAIFGGEPGLVILDLGAIYHHAARELGRDPDDNREAPE